MLSLQLAVGLPLGLQKCAVDLPVLPGPLPASFTNDASSGDASVMTQTEQQVHFWLKALRTFNMLLKLGSSTGNGQLHVLQSKQLC